MRDLRSWEERSLAPDEGADPVAPGKLSLTSRLVGPASPPLSEASTWSAGAGLYGRLTAPLQADAGSIDPFGLHLAERGVEGSSAALPHRDAIQASFGHHDVSGVRAHVGGDAAVAAGAMQTRAYATGDDVAFAAAPDLRLAAHEAAHVVQQRGGVRLEGGVGQRGDAYERHADEVADLVVRGQSAEALLDTMAHRGPSGGSAVIQRDELATSPDEIVIDPQHVGEVVGVWRGSVYDANVVTSGVLRPGGLSGRGTPLEAGEGHYASEAAAIAACHTYWHNAQAGAIFLENGRYVAYWCHSNDMLFDFTWDNVRRVEGQPWTAVEFTGNCRAIVLRDNVILRREMYCTEEEAATRAPAPELMPGATDPIPGYRELYGDFSEMEPGRFLLMFDDALKANALVVLQRSQIEAAQIKERYANPLCAPETGDEWARMEAACNQLVDLDDQIAMAQAEYDGAQSGVSLDGGVQPPGGAPDSGAGGDTGDLDGGTGGWDGGTDGGDTGYDGPDTESARLRLEELQQQRRVALLEYPLLGHMDTDELREFQALPLPQKVTSLNGQLGTILEDIETTRDNIIDGTLDLWALPNMVNATIASLGVTNPDLRTAIADEVSSRHMWDAIFGVGMAVLAIGLGLVATFATGGLALGAAAGALGIGAADAMMQTRDYFAEDAASNTDVNVDESIVPDDLAAHWGWLVLAWAGVGLDALDVIRAVRAVKAAADAGGEMAEAIARGIDELAPGNADMAGRLRVAAGQVDEVISEANRGALATRLGAEVEIVDDLVEEVRVYYRVDDATKNIIVTSVRCGRAARVGEVLAHENVIRLLTRYNGALGEMRRLWDRIVSFAGFSPTGCLHPPGSAAYESWHELSKLDEIIAGRQDQLADALGTADESVIRRDVEFLESERARHAAVVDQLTIESGSGFIARAEEQTRNAIDNHGMPELVGNSMIPDPTQYYYRSNPGREPPFVLCRVSTSAAEPRTLVRDGTGWRIDVGGLSRSEEAAEMWKAWPDLEDAAQAFEAAFPTALHHVPLEGVATTGENLGELIRRSGSWDEMRGVLEEAYRRAGHADPSAAADAAMQAVDAHTIVVVRGTDQLRAFNYRLRFAGETGAEALHDLHHIIPLQLGGGHLPSGLLDIHPDLHRQLHEIIDHVDFDSMTTLAPHSIRDGAALQFDRGAAALMPDGTVQLVKLNPDGTFTRVP